MQSARSSPVYVCVYMLLVCICYHDSRGQQSCQHDQHRKSCSRLGNLVFILPSLHVRYAYVACMDLYMLYIYIYIYIYILVICMSHTASLQRACYVPLNTPRTHSSFDHIHT